MGIRPAIAASILFLSLSASMGLVATGPVLALDNQPRPTQRVARNLQDLSLDQANVALQAALAQAIALNTKMDIAVVGVGGHLKAFVRMDGACLGCIDIAIRKARTARFFDRPTGELGDLAQPGQPLYGIEHSNDGLISFPGGVPIKNTQGEIIGAIGVSGDTVENDHLVATAGADAILN